MNTKTKANISKLLVMMGTILFVGGAMSYQEANCPQNKSQELVLWRSSLWALVRA